MDGTSAAAAPANAFGSEDFIAFDFGDEFNSDTTRDQAGSSAAANGSSSRSDRRSGQQRDRETRDAQASSSAAGRKRKIDDREDDGKTKQERRQERREARSRLTPWSADVDWERCRNGAEMLHRELMAFDTWLAPTYAEHETRCMVIDLIGRAIKGRWKDAQVRSFGSQETKLYLPQGDIDLVVVSDMMEYQRRETVLRAMAATLRQHNLATEVQVIARAKVPIVKFVCTYAKLRVDISVNQVNGLSAAKYVNSWLRKVPSMRPLVMAVKHLLVQRGMSEVFSGGLGSYSVIIMVISFLQLHPKVQRGEIDPARNLGVLFLELLELYGKNFGYDTCGITIRGKGGYFSKARRGWKDERKPFMLCIEDPHDPTNDISRGSYGILNTRAALAGAFDIVTAAICQKGSGAADRISAASQKPKHHTFGDDSEDEDAAARRLLLEEARGGRQSDGKDPDSLLGTIVGVSNAMLNHRQELEDLYHSGALQNRLGRPPPRPSPTPADRYLRAPPVPTEPRASRAQPSQGPSPKKIRGRAQRLAEENANSRSGNRSDPISLSSSPSRDVGPGPASLSIRGAAEKRQQTSHANGRAKASRSVSPEIVDEAELAASQGFSFSSGSGSNPTQQRGEDLMGISEDATAQTLVHANGVIEILSGSDEEDSRYNAPRFKRRKVTHSNSPLVGANGKRNPAADMESLANSAPNTFVDDSSDDGLAAAAAEDAGRGKGRTKAGSAAAQRASSADTKSDAAGETGLRRSRRLSAQSSSMSPVKPSAASGLKAVQEAEPAMTNGSPAKKLTNRARREFWAAKGAVSPREREEEAKDDAEYA